MTHPPATLQLSGQEEARILFGPQDRNLRLVRERFGVQIVARDLKVRVSGKERDAHAAVDCLTALLDLARAGGSLSLDEVEAQLASAPRALSPGGAEAGPPRTPRSPRAGPEDGASVDGVHLRTPGQRRYADAIRKHAMVFAVGPAGTGKTFLAVLMAVHALKRGEVQRLVLCRPAVEAGEKLGFLPGDFQAKVNPYMRPLYDALYALLDFETVKRYLEREVIEIAPLAYMRGRTLGRCFVILDEAQNTTRAQMKMFLTRMGEDSKVVVTGDVTQLDLPDGVESGLVHACDLLEDVEGIAQVHLTARDVVRNPLVAKVLERYEADSDPTRQDEEA